jgi:hypothetical protein
MTEPTSATAGLMAAIIKTAPEWVPAVFGAAISLRFLGNTINVWQRWAAFAGGAVTAFYVGQGAAEYMHITTPKVASLMIFVSGVAGMAVMQALFTEIPAAITALRRKWIGE